MDHRFLAEILAHKPLLFRAMLNFNREFTSVPVELSSCGDAFVRLWNCESFRRAWTPHPSEETGYWNFSEESQRLALLDAITLERLGLFFSAAVHAEELSHVIEREQVRELRQTLGMEIFTYALKRGRYQVGGLRSVLTVPPEYGTLPLRIRTLAATALRLVGSEWPEQLRTLAFPLFPPMENDQRGEKTFSPVLRREQRTALWFTMKKLLLKEVAPEWAPCFD